MSDRALIGRFITPSGEASDVYWHDGVFVVGEETVPAARLAAWDRSGHMEWSDAPTKQWYFRYFRGVVEQPSDTAPAGPAKSPWAVEYMIVAALLAGLIAGGGQLVGYLMEFDLLHPYTMVLVSALTCLVAYGVGFQLYRQAVLSFGAAPNVWRSFLAAPVWGLVSGLASSVNGDDWRTGAVRMVVGAVLCVGAYVAASRTDMEANLAAQRVAALTLPSTARAKQVMVGGVISLLVGPVVLMTSAALFAGAMLGADVPEVALPFILAGLMVGILMVVVGIVAIVVGLAWSSRLRSKAASSV